MGKKRREDWGEGYWEGRGDRSEEKEKYNI